MPFTDEDEHFIKNILREEQRYSCSKFIREFPNKNFECAKVRSVRARSALHDDNIDVVADLVQSQEDRP